VGDLHGVRGQAVGLDIDCVYLGGFGVGVETEGARRGRYGWSGGQGTNFYVDPDGTVGILLTQVEMGERLGRMVDEFQALPPPS
jgi:hypothetical protein